MVTLLEVVTCLEAELFWFSGGRLESAQQARHQVRWLLRKEEKFQVVGSAASGAAGCKCGVCASKYSILHFRAVCVKRSWDVCVLEFGRSCSAAAEPDCIARNEQGLVRLLRMGVTGRR